MVQPVLIIGGGLSGLTLAHSLQQQGIPYKLFERDTGKEGRLNQGWSISLRFCLPALAKVMDPVHFSTLGSRTSVNTDHPDDVQFAYVDGITSETLLIIDPKKTMQATRPTVYRINRKRFRSWLLEGLDVTWNKRLARYRILSDDEQEGGGGVEATFTDGTTARGSVLVGADGVNSVVCEQLMTTTTNHVDAFHQATTINPTRCLVMLRWLTEEEYAPLRSYSMTSFFVFGSLHRGGSEQEKETVCAFMSLNDIHPDPNVKRKFQVMLSMSRYDKAKIIPWYEENEKRLQQLKAWAKDGFEGEVQRVLLKMPEQINDETDQVTYLTIRERSPHPDSLANHQGRIALVGDAAHAMTMFRGEGGNHAILDATVLGQALGDAYNVDKEFTLFDAIEKYNEEMIPRGTRAVKESHDAAYDTHNSPETVVKTMKSFMDALNRRSN